MACAITADILISRVGEIAAGIADAGRNNSRKSPKCSFYAPKAACRKRSLFHSVLQSIAIRILDARAPGKSRATLTDPALHILLCPRVLTHYDDRPRTFATGGEDVTSRHTIGAGLVSSNCHHDSRFSVVFPYSIRQALDAGHGLRS